MTALPAVVRTIMPTTKHRINTNRNAIKSSPGSQSGIKRATGFTSPLIEPIALRSSRMDKYNGTITINPVTSPPSRYLRILFIALTLRNAVNVGLPVLICNTDKINDGDDLEIDLASGTVKDLTNGAKLTSGAIPDVMLKILSEGGLVPYIKKYGDFKV